MTTLTISPPGKGRILASRILRVPLGLAFLAAAGAKLAGVAMMVQIFDQIGLGQGFRYVTAFVEIAGAVALFVPGLTALAALWLAVTMVFAFLAHVTILHSNPAGAVVLFVLASIVAWTRREQIDATLHRFR